MAMPDATVNKNLEGGGFRARVQRFGGYLAGMIMPNIAAFIAWGLITALFIPDGWTPNAKLAELVGPIITFLLPILIGYTGRPAWCTASVARSVGGGGRPSGVVVAAPHPTCRCSSAR